MNPGVEPGAAERMLSTELIDPFANLICFFERGVERKRLAPDLPSGVAVGDAVHVGRHSALRSVP